MSTPQQPKNSAWRLLAAVVTSTALCLGATSAKAQGCTKDTDCKGDRICVQGYCQDPMPAAPPGSAAPPASAQTHTAPAAVAAPPMPAAPVALAFDEIQLQGTTLVWKRCPVGQTWNGAKCRGFASRRLAWHVALASCPTGYRLASKEDFMALLSDCHGSLYENRKGYCRPCKRSGVCRSVCPRGDDLMYWSATPYIGDSNRAWRVNADDGGIGPVRTSEGLAARCVRDLPR